MHLTSTTSPLNLLSSSSAPTFQINRSYVNITSSRRCRHSIWGSPRALSPTLRRNSSTHALTLADVDLSLNFHWESPGMPPPGFTPSCKIGQSDTETVNQLTRSRPPVVASPSLYQVLSMRSSKLGERPCKPTSILFSEIVTPSRMSHNRRQYQHQHHRHRNQQSSSLHGALSFPAIAAVARHIRSERVPF